MTADKAPCALSHLQKPVRSAGLILYLQLQMGKSRFTEVKESVHKHTANGRQSQGWNSELLT